MLKRMKAERRDGSGVRVSENAKHAAFFAQRISVEIKIQIRAKAGFVRVRSVAVCASHGRLLNSSAEKHVRIHSVET
jgi:hypothetical protein